jgi:hypothetical protein
MWMEDDVAGRQSDSDTQTVERFGAASARDALETMRERLKGPWDWNKVGIGAGAAAAVIGAALAAGKYIRRGEAQEDDFQLRLETDENLRLISSKKVDGTPVVDRKGEKIGTIDNFMVDKYTGRVVSLSASLAPPRI